jgi:ABC-2 type transport system ATP-binding protein
VLSDVRLELGRGEIYGLLGPNGAGKSTTIAAAIGLLRPDGGEIRLFNENPFFAIPSLRKRFGVLPERIGYYDWMTPHDYLAFYGALYGKALTAADLDARLVQLGLSKRPRQPIGTLSHGMRQRLGLARALIGDPDLLILDEPTSGLDPRGRREIHDLLLELTARGVGILLCTHLLEDVERLCRRVGIIVEGRTIAHGTVAELLMQTGDARSLEEAYLEITQRPHTCTPRY